MYLGKSYRRDTVCTENTRGVKVDIAYLLRCGLIQHQYILFVETGCGVRANLVRRLTKQRVK